MASRPPRDNDRQEGVVIEPELQQVAAFRTELRRFLRRTYSVAAEAGLTPQRYDLLLMISAAGELRVNELCERLQLQQTAVTELLKRTEEAGLIQRRASKEDRRASLFRLTAEGERRLMQAFEGLRRDREALAASFVNVDRSFRAAGGDGETA